jgi:hypothetical protein
MSTLIKNGIPHPKFGSGEIIPTTSQLISDSGQDYCKDSLHSSEDSLDSCEEKNSFQQSSGIKKKIKLKVRSISDSTDEEVILFFKYCVVSVAIIMYCKILIFIFLNRLDHVTSLTKVF